MSDIKFFNEDHEVIRIDAKGFHYRGQFIEDAGEAHRLLVEFLRKHQPEVNWQHASQSTSLLTMTELSSAAQAVLDAALPAYDDEHLYTFPEKKHASMIAAAALRAAAVEIVLPKYQYADWEMADLIMREIQAVADELEDH